MEVLVLGKGGKINKAGGEIRKGKKSVKKAEINAKLTLCRSNFGLGELKQEYINHGHQKKGRERRIRKRIMNIGLPSLLLWWCII